MFKSRKGVRVPLSPARKMVCELLHHARKVPSIPLRRSMNIRALAAVRAQMPSRPSWVALFLKAFALAARNRPELRRSYVPFPWPHLYQHPISECAVLVGREWGDEHAVMAAKIREPESQPLQSIDAMIKRFTSAPAETVSDLRQVARLGRLPAFARRWAFWTTLNLSGYTKSKRFGTFMISSLGKFGVEQVHSLAPLTTYVSFGPISANGDVSLRVIYDHRVLDGPIVAAAMEELEEIMNGAILAELESTTLRAAV